MSDHPSATRFESRQRPTLAITCGEPAGIGPEISIRAAWELRAEVRSVLLGDAAYLAQTAHGLDASIALSAISLQAFRNTGLPDFPQDRLTVIDCPVNEPIVPGVLDARNGRAVLQALDVAVEGALKKHFDAIVTAPLQKSTINDAGVPFTGHTEYLAERTATPQVVMMLAGGEHPYLRVALATTHLALKDVPAAITFDSLSKTLNIIHADLRDKFGIGKPRILVTGLNPHAGKWLSRTRRNRRHHSGAGCSQGARHGCGRSLPGRHLVPAKISRARRLRACHVSRSGLARTQVRQLRPGRQYHARPADHSHLRRPPHGAGSGSQGFG